VKDGDCKFFCLVEFVKSFKEDERGGNTFHWFLFKKGS
jgi:hypothetical protein